MASKKYYSLLLAFALILCLSACRASSCGCPQAEIIVPQTDQR